jgi:hypothetical protein
LGVVLNELGVGRIESDLSFERVPGVGHRVAPTDPSVQGSF